MTDLEDRIETTKKNLTTNRKIWTKTIVNRIDVRILCWLCIVYWQFIKKLNFNRPRNYI